MNLKEAKSFTGWLSNCIVIGYITVLLICFAYDNTGYGRDSTDGDDRSNMLLRIDHGTGCEYLETRNGGITPRLTGEGLQSGCSLWK